MSGDSLAFKVIVSALDDRDSVSADTEDLSLDHRIQTRRTYSLNSGEPEIRLSSSELPFRDSDNPVLSDVGPRCLECV